jgi:hypothetical protein
MLPLNSIERKQKKVGCSILSYLFGLWEVKDLIEYIYMLPMANCHEIVGIVKLKA